MQAISNGIFISSTTKGLKDYRVMTAEVVAAQGFTPVHEEHFGLPTRRMDDELPAKIAGCIGFLALVGAYHGSESNVRDESGVWSHTRCEIEYALSRGKPCQIFFTSRGFVPEPADAWAQGNDEEERQMRFIARLKSRPEGLGWAEFKDRTELALHLAKHRWHEWLSWKK